MRSLKRITSRFQVRSVLSSLGLPGGTFRHQERVPVRRAMAVEVLHSSALMAQCVDISPNGIGLRLDTDVEVGDRLVFELALPGLGTHRLVGEVRHVTETGSGHTFAGLRWVKPSAITIMIRALMIFIFSLKSILIGQPGIVFAGIKRGQ